MRNNMHRANPVFIPMEIGSWEIQFYASKSYIWYVTMCYGLFVCAACIHPNSEPIRMYILMSLTGRNHVHIQMKSKILSVSMPKVYALSNGTLGFSVS
jgi:hypothetical protein